MSETSQFNVWEGRLRELIAGAARAVGNLAGLLGRCPGPTTEAEARELLRFREALGLRPWPLPPPGEGREDYAAGLFGEIVSAAQSLGRPFGELLAAADRALSTQAQAGNEALLWCDDFGDWARVVSWEPRTVPYAVGIVAKLPAGHHARALVDPEELYRWGAVPVLVMGDARPVVDPFAQRDWRPQPWYGAAAVAALTRRLSAEQRAEDEARRRSAEYQAERRAREAEAEAELERQLEKVRGRRG